MHLQMEVVGVVALPCIWPRLDIGHTLCDFSGSSQGREMVFLFSGGQRRKVNRFEGACMLELSHSH